ncbi:PsiF family protein [Methylorubrum rhodinum]
MKSCNADAGMQKLAGDARKSFRPNALPARRPRRPRRD